MKQQVKKWALRLTATGFLLLGILVGIVLNPTLLYANKTVVGNYAIYHNAPLDKSLVLRLDNATELLKNSECYDANLKLDICLPDGSAYTTLLEKLGGQAYGWGFADKVVVMGNANYKDNYVELNGYQWNFTQLLAHEAIHCFQFHKFGFWHSNPMAGYPNWKWEGYPEYVARRNADQLRLAKNIARKIETENLDKDAWAINFGDSTIVSKNYYNDWLLVQYCLDIKGMTYENLLKDTTKEETIKLELMEWFHLQNKEDKK
jgi:hypothetical protein